MRYIRLRRRGIAITIVGIAVLLAAVVVASLGAEARVMMGVGLAGFALACVGIFTQRRIPRYAQSHRR